LALGVPPGTAIRTNTIGILFSTIGSVAGYRTEIAAERKNLAPLVAVTAVTATTGAVALLLSPASALDVVVPVLIVAALLMVVFQRRITAAIRRGRERRAPRPAAGAGPTAADEAVAPDRSPYRSPALIGAMGAASVYGGYFTAAQ